MAADRTPTYADPALIDGLMSRIGALEAAMQPDNGDRTQQYRQGQAVLGGLAWGSGQDTVSHQGSEFVRNGPVDPASNLDARFQDLQAQIDFLDLLGSNGTKDLNQSNSGSVSQRKGDDGNTGSDNALPTPGDAGTVLTSNGYLVDPSYQALPPSVSFPVVSATCSAFTSSTTFAVTYSSSSGNLSGLNTGTGTFTVPKDGNYLILFNGTIGLSGTVSANPNFGVGLQFFSGGNWFGITGGASFNVQGLSPTSIQVSANFATYQTFTSGTPLRVFFSDASGATSNSLSGNLTIVSFGA